MNLSISIQFYFGRSHHCFRSTLNSMYKVAYREDKTGICQVNHQLFLLIHFDVCSYNVFEPAAAVEYESPEFITKLSNKVPNLTFMFAIYGRITLLLSLSIKKIEKFPYCCWHGIYIYIYNTYRE